jgi:hypothetical protein
MAAVSCQGDQPLKFEEPVCAQALVRDEDVARAELAADEGGVPRRPDHTCTAASFRAASLRGSAASGSAARTARARAARSCPVVMVPARPSRELTMPLAASAGRAASCSRKRQARAKPISPPAARRQFSMAATIRVVLSAASERLDANPLAKKALPLVT